MVLFFNIQQKVAEIPILTSPHFSPFVDM